MIPLFQIGQVKRELLSYPWRWEINLKAKKIDLCGGPAFDLTIMAFERWGMGGARPIFLTIGDSLLLDKPEYFTKPILGREHHAAWLQTIDHPIANLLASGPELLEELKFWTGQKHEGDCCYTDKADEGCYLCGKAALERWPKTKALIARMEGKV